MPIFRSLPLPVALAVLALGCGHAPEVGRPPATGIPPLHGAPPAAWEDSVLRSLTIEQKAGQVLVVWAGGQYASSHSDDDDRLVHAVCDLGVGGVLLRQSDVYEIAVRLNRLQRLATVPLLVSADLERGLAMRVRRATPIPEAMAIGATGNPRLAYEAGRAVAEEARALGIHQTFAPVADINTNPLNPVINTRSFGDDPRLVSVMVRAYIRGTTDGGVLATVKHFPGHGETGVDSHIELPVLTVGTSRLDTMEMATFRAALDAGVPSVLVAHVAVPALDSARQVPASLSTRVVGRLLRHDLGYDGLVVTDAMEMRGITSHFPPARAAVLALKAGVDIVLAPPDPALARAAIIEAVASGELPQAQLDAAVRRILRAKRSAGLDHSRITDIGKIADVVGTRDHLALAREIAREAMTVVRNEGGILPLANSARSRVGLIVVTEGEDSRTEVHRPWASGANEPTGAYLMAQLRRRVPRLEVARIHPASDAGDIERALHLATKSEATVVAMFVKVRSASGQIEIPRTLSSFVLQLEKATPRLVVVSFGSPYLLHHFPFARGLMCAYGDGEPVVEAAADVLAGEAPACGKLPVTIPGVAPFGSGAPCPPGQLRPDTTVDGKELFRRVDSLLVAAIRDSAFPAAQIIVVQRGLILHQRSLGAFTYDTDEKTIDSSTLFDLASVSKVIGTTTAIMKLVDGGMLSLEDRVSRHLPRFSGERKDDITIRQLLRHRGGLPPFRRFYTLSADPRALLDSLYATPLIAAPGDTTIYSDLGMILLGKVVESVTRMSLAEYLDREFFTPLGMANTMYNPPPSLWNRTAPTEVDTAWRHTLVRGMVHDENAAALGGIAGHAGLFSTASDLAVIVQMVMNGGTYAGHRYVRREIVEEFTRAAAGGDRFLGWDKKSPAGSSAGSRFSVSSFGHTGFTGTSIWADPERKLFVILLTNRVFPTRANTKISKVRPEVHDAVIEALEGPPKTG